MQTEKLNFEFYGIKGIEKNVCFIRFSGDTLQFLEFQKPVKKITHNQFFDLMAKINQVISDIEAKKDLTISEVNPENLPEIPGIKKGFAKSVFDGINKLEKTGQLSESDIKLKNNAFALISKLLKG